MSKKKLRWNKKIVFRNLFLILLIGGIIYGTYILLSQAPLLDIRSIDVIGIEKLDKKEVVEKSNIRIGQNIFKIDKKYANTELEKMVYIKSVKIKRKLPDKVVLEVVEEKEIAVMKSDKNYVVGQGLNILRVLNENETVNIPEIYGLSYKKTKTPNSYIYNEKVKDSQIIQLLNNLGDSYLKGKITNITIDEKQNMHILLNNNAIIKLGEIKDTDYKLKYLKEIIKDLEKKGVAYSKIDFTKSKKVVVEEIIQRDAPEEDQEGAE